MQFLVIAYDDTDEQAIERRMKARDAHLESARMRYDRGEWLYAAGILDDDGKMIGSMIVCEYGSRDDLEKWLVDEPYITGDVWKSIDVKRTRVAPFCGGKGQ